MDVAIGLPNTVPGTDGEPLTEFVELSPALRERMEMLPILQRVWSGEELGVAGGIGPEVGGAPDPEQVGLLAEAAL